MSLCEALLTSGSSRPVPVINADPVRTIDRRQDTGGDCQFGARCDTSRVTAPVASRHWRDPLPTADRSEAETRCPWKESLQCQSICSCVNVKVPHNPDKASTVAASTLISLAAAIVHRRSKLLCVPPGLPLEARASLWFSHNSILFCTSSRVNSEGSCLSFEGK